MEVCINSIVIVLWDELRELDSRNEHGIIVQKYEMKHVIGWTYLCMEVNRRKNIDLLPAYRLVYVS